MVHSGDKLLTTDEINAEVDKILLGDLISRQAAIDACNQSINILEATDRIRELSPVKRNMTAAEYKEHRRKSARECQRKRRIRAKEQGLCSICCNEIPETGYKTCKKCRLIISAKRGMRYGR